MEKTDNFIFFVAGSVVCRPYRQLFGGLCLSSAPDKSMLAVPSDSRQGNGAHCNLFDARTMPCKTDANKPAFVSSDYFFNFERLE